MLLFFGAVLVVTAVAVAVLATSVGPGESRGVARSLELVNYSPTRTTVAKHELAARDRLLDPMISGLRRVAVRMSPSGTGDRIARSLDKAGNPAAWTIERIMGTKGIGLLLGAVLALVILGFNVRGVLAAVALSAAGFFVPDLLVYNMGMKRQTEMRKGLADALDMLTVCVEAGQGFDAAILQVAKTVTGPIGGEFARVLSEIQIGKSRADAFAALGARTTAAEVKTFVSALVQADRMGLPVAAVLREQTREMRIARRQRAEEAAQKVTVKILFPLLLCIFPALFIVIIGPGAIKIADAFSNGGL
ncbi:type II secretion system F family protein [Knoellia aerolata]|nr:type II secretion system F family protein [Knoellia aerolata]